MTADHPQTPADVAPALEIRDLTVEFGRGASAERAVDGVDLTLAAGTSLALVGESGSGKSVTASSILGLLPPSARVVSGSISVGGEDLAHASEARLRRFRGSHIGMVFQNPLASLDPSFRIGNQIREVISIHQPASRRPAQEEFAKAWLNRVGIADADRVLRAYPHELSGGMRQRVMIAVASLSQPAILIADEPTTALDAVIQRQILDLLLRVVSATGSSLLIITHDFGVVSYVADHVAVMKDGRIVEYGTKKQVLCEPRDRYTRSLIDAVPAIGARFVSGFEASKPRLGSHTRTQPSTQEHHPPTTPPPVPRPEHPNPLLEVESVSKEFVVGGFGTGLPRRRLLAVDDVSFDISRGEILGLIGESGSGKSTLTRLIGGLIPVTSGRVIFDGVDIAAAHPGRVRKLRPRFQFIFQDATSSLNPRVPVGEQIARPLRRFGKATSPRDARRTITETLELVELPARYADRYPHELSGGQRQRIGIARAIALRPDLLILDEPTSALDVSTQASIIDLLLDLRDALDLTYLFIGHNLSVIEFVCDRIAVLDSGRLVDIFSTRELVSPDRVEVTRALLDAVLPIDL